jgi:hypothetical protein
MLNGETGVLARPAVRGRPALHCFERRDNEGTYRNHCIEG